MRKLTPEQLKRYSEAQDTRRGKMHIEVDELRRKNLQAWIPYELWTSIKAQVEDENTSMNKFVEQALATYLLLEDEDITRILSRHSAVEKGG